MISRSKRKSLFTGAKAPELKLPTEFPDGFALKIDTRERAPLFLGKRPLKGLSIVRDTLAVGDYSIKGCEDEIAIERKSLGDLYNCMGKDRKRFMVQMDKLSKLFRKWLLIEGTEEETHTPQEYSTIHPNSVRGTLVSIDVRYGIPIYFSPSKKNSERFILDRFKKFALLKEEKRHGSKKESS